MTNRLYYQANEASPVIVELTSLAMKTVGVADVLREALLGLQDRITVAFVHGSLARHTENTGSDVDLVVVGAVRFGDLVAAIRPAQDAIGCEVNPVTYPVREFRAKLRAKHHFLSSVINGPKIFLIGSERELKRLGAQRVARRAQGQSARD